MTKYKIAIILQHNIDNNKKTEKIVLSNAIEYMQHLSHEMTNLTHERQVRKQLDFYCNLLYTDFINVCSSNM